MTNEEQVLQQVETLKGANRFDLARRALEALPVAPSDAIYAKVQQQIALCTYKDEELPRPHRFYEALDILENRCNLKSTTDCETLGLGGAVYKRLWDYNGQRTALERALACYQRGYAQNPDDDGYVAVNTAFILDVLASKERETLDDPTPDVPAQRFAEADKIRKGIVARWGESCLANPTWWACASVGESAFALGDFVTAAAALNAGLKTKPKSWERDTLIKQLAQITRIQSARRGDGYKGDAAKTLQDVLNVSDAAVQSILLGKVGLALSGGGFRASLYHIGVLAKLAELDLLRHIEVLSCVSGGSIIGAHYYLELKRELEKNEVLSRADYIGIVSRVEKEFLRGVQSNIRTRVASSIPASLQMAFQPGYTRTSRAGELYEKRLYSRIDGIGSRPLRSLPIKPKGTTSFSPRYDNWSHVSKVPMLVLNATAINTGHNWQFTATWMGESPQAINGAIDAIPRLRRMYIDGRDPIPQKFQDIPLGQAVGASAAVPGVFEPIELRNAYPDWTVRLSDGGVHDNQGLASLLEESCKVLLVSDASGQMEEDDNPAGGALSVGLRTNTILQARVREAQYDQLQTLSSSGAVDGAMFIHLTKDLESPAVAFAGSSKQPAPPPSDRTEYLVDRVVQKQLAEIRTDLDSFSDAEAYGLMMSGYLMADHALLQEKCAPTLLSVANVNDPPVAWDFRRVENALTAPGSADNLRMRGLLKASKQLAGKVWRQVLALQLVAGAGGVALIAWVVVNRHAIAASLKTATAIPRVTWQNALIGAAALAAIVIVRYFFDKVLQYQKRIGQFLLGIGLATVGFVAAWLHLTIFDQIFLWHGRWDAPPAPPSPGAFAPPGGPMLTIKAPVPPPAPAAQPPSWTPVVRRVLNLFSR